MARKKRLESFGDDEFKDICLKSNSFKEMYIGFGYSWQSKHLKKEILVRANSLGIIGEIEKNLSPKTRTSIKKKFKESLSPEEIKCSECHIGEWWNGKMLVLQLDHKNGISHDNEYDNLRLLCPNCHSQTHTYSRPHKVRKNKCL